jgi:hypothetical protein
VIKKSAEDAARFWLDSPVLGVKRSPKNRTDFGDSETVGLSLRRVGFSMSNPEFKPDDSFGTFLGEHPEGWIVGVKKFDYSGWAACEIHDTLESLKRHWELD